MSRENYYQETVKLAKLTAKNKVRTACMLDLLAAADCISRATDALSEGPKTLDWQVDYLLKQADLAEAKLHKFGLRIRDFRDLNTPISD